MTSAVQPLEDIDVDAAGPDDTQFWSVTTILKVLASRALEYWAIKRCAEDAIEYQGVWQPMLEQMGREEAIKWMCKARDRRPKYQLGADQLGTVVHKLCEMYALTGVRPDRQTIEDLIVANAKDSVRLDAEIAIVTAMIDQFDNWLQRFTPVYTAAEMAVYSRKYGYAGSLDAIFTIDNVRLLIDYKTRREPLTARGGPQLPYKETALQLAAYRHADACAVWRARRTEIFRRRYYLLSTTENGLAVPVPEVDGAGCLIITTQSCELYPVKADRSVFEFFLHTQECFRWEEDEGRRVIGDALVKEGQS
jgi:hypothetical protein